MAGFSDVNRFLISFFLLKKKKLRFLSKINTVETCVRLTTSWHATHISFPLRRRMVLLISGDWTKLNTLRPVEVWCSDWGNARTDSVLTANTLYEVQLCFCVQNIKHINHKKCPETCVFSSLKKHFV